MTVRKCAEFQEVAHDVKTQRGVNLHIRRAARALNWDPDLIVDMATGKEGMDYASPTGEVGWSFVWDGNDLHVYMYSKL